MRFVLKLAVLNLVLSHEDLCRCCDVDRHCFLVPFISISVGRTIHLDFGENCVLSIIFLKVNYLAKLVLLLTNPYIYIFVSMIIFSALALWQLTHSFGQPHALVLISHMLEKLIGSACWYSKLFILLNLSFFNTQPHGYDNDHIPNMILAFCHMVDSLWTGDKKKKKIFLSLYEEGCFFFFFDR